MISIVSLLVLSNVSVRLCIRIRQFTYLSPHSSVHLCKLYRDHHVASSYRSVSRLEILQSICSLSPSISFSDVPWYADSEWNNVKGQLSTVDRHYGFVHSMIHTIGTHQIHHLFTKVPHYHLGRY